MFNNTIDIEKTLETPFDEMVLGFILITIGLTLDIISSTTYLMILYMCGSIVVTTGVMIIIISVFRMCDF